MNRFILSGLIVTVVASGGLIYDTLYPPQLNFTEPPPPHTLADNQQQGPQRILIPNLNIDENIVPGLIQNNIWSVADRDANHLATSATPGEAGNIIVYGHDDSDLFGALEQAQIGHTITLLDYQGKSHPYRISSITTTGPDDVRLVQPTTQEVLTVYTCTGFANSRRLIIQAQPLPHPDAAVDQPS